MGPTVLFADNFQIADPAWHGEITVSGANANVTYPAGNNYGVAFYGGKFIDSGDLCVDVVAPVADLNGKPIVNNYHGGIIFGFNDIDNYFAFIVSNDGTAKIFEAVNGGYLTFVTGLPAPSLLTAPNSKNTLRVTWNGNTASTYINSQPVYTFTKLPAFHNSMVGFYADSDSGVPLTYQFGNLKVTNVP
jgi:hypothetical protein